MLLNMFKIKGLIVVDDLLFRYCINSASISISSMR